jgi:putative addiction module killer protein
MRIEFHDGSEYRKWLRSIGDDAAGRVAGKVEFVASLGGIRVGLPLVRSLGHGLFELRVSIYRVYFTQTGPALLILTTGVKDTQVRDIARARRRLP